MLKKTQIQCFKQAYQAKKVNNSQGLQLVPLTHSIRELIALGGLVVVSAGALAEDQIHPNDIWIKEGLLRGFCVQDNDQDGDLDVFLVYRSVVNRIENTGSPVSPEFASPKPFSNDSGHFKLISLGLARGEANCRHFDDPLLVDIDADGDLDLFSIIKVKTFAFQANRFITDGTIYG